MTSTIKIRVGWFTREFLLPSCSRHFARYISYVEKISGGPNKKVETPHLLRRKCTSAVVGRDVTRRSLRIKSRQHCHRGESTMAVDRPLQPPFDSLHFPSLRYHSHMSIKATDVDKFITLPILCVTWTPDIVEGVACQSKHPNDEYSLHNGVRSILDAWFQVIHWCICLGDLLCVLVPPKESLEWASLLETWLKEWLPEQWMSSIKNLNTVTRSVWGEV